MTIKVTERERRYLIAVLERMAREGSRVDQVRIRRILAKLKWVIEVNW